LGDMAVTSAVVGVIAKGVHFWFRQAGGPTGQRAQCAFNGFGVIRAERGGRMSSHVASNGRRTGWGVCTSLCDDLNN
jgi:hypothetical protein